MPLSSFSDLMIKPVGFNIESDSIQDLDSAGSYGNYRVARYVIMTPRMSGYVHNSLQDCDYKKACKLLLDHDNLDIQAFGTLLYSLPSVRGRHMVKVLQYIFNNTNI